MPYIPKIRLEELDYTQDLEHWEIARDLEANPGRLLYPTDDYIHWMDFEQSEAIEPLIGHGIFRNPIKVGIAKKKWLDRMARSEEERSAVLESLAFERWIANHLLTDSLTLDAREAARHISDKYTGPKE